MALADLPTEHLTDVSGLRLGHYHRQSSRWRTGTTVVVCEHGAVAGVDVRGGGPGTRETDLLRPENLVQQVQAICLTGGSAFGLAAADGVMHVLEERGLGFPVGGNPSYVVPIVPSAVIFDLGRAGTSANRPDPTFGRRATEAAFRRTTPLFPHSAIGAGTGARSGGLQGGVGMASQLVDLNTMLGSHHSLGAEPIVVSALAVVNSVGSVINPRSALPWDDSLFDTSPLLRPPSVGDQRRFSKHLQSLRAQTSSPLNTTIGVVATNLPLSKAECTKFAAVAHDGLARAIRPAHSMHDGDTIFGLSTGTRPDMISHSGLRPDMISHSGLRPEWWPAVMNLILRAGAEVFATACTRAVVQAATIGGPPSYRELCPSAFVAQPRTAQPRTEQVGPQSRSTRGQ